ncbi:MAG: malonyl-CoA decarboxylase family protein [Candidatus Dormibacteraeota bacterium]|nr:malonyl-CoA decarboxylase family protein [Candidatus Dormibacteraeota bacterium]
MRGRTWLEQVGVIADRGREILSRGPSGRAPHTAEALCEKLLAQRGEASGVALASELVRAIRAMDGGQTARFLDMLAARFGPDAERVDGAVQQWLSRRDAGAIGDLAAAAESPRQELFRRLNVAPGGIDAMVQLRARALELLPEASDLRPVEADLHHLFSSWFNPGFLRLEEVNWHTPAAILERLILYEAVHEIHGWDDLRLRLAADRRCYAFFHPALPDEPLIFVEVALTRGLAGAIGPLIDPRREVASPSVADSAIFYSISNCQRGLRGISFGSFLIKRVVSELTADVPWLKTFATLSPLPGLRRAVEDTDLPDAFTEERLRVLIGDRADELCRLAETGDPVAALRRLLSAAGPRPAPVQAVLRRLALDYLLHVRKGRRVADPVGHFHLANGARLESIDLDADLSEGGRASYGVMVNYLYEPQTVELNHERYVESGEVPMSRGLLAESRRLVGARQQAS